jgi:phosphonate transport system substrate-binding protein
MKRALTLAGCGTAFIGVAMLLSSCRSPVSSDFQPVLGTRPARVPSRPEYLVGVLPGHNAIRVLELYQPLIDELNSVLPDFQLAFETTREQVSYERKVRDRQVHFAFLFAHQLIKAEEHGYEVFARPADHVRGVIVTREDRALGRVRDLRGQAISFAGPRQLAGGMMPALFLKQGGVNVIRDRQARYVGSEESALVNVYLGLTAAGAVSESAWRAFRESRPEIAKKLKVRWTTEPLRGMGLVARDDVPALHVRALATALFDLPKSERGRQVLAGARLSRFIPADAASFDGVWEFLNEYQRAFGVSLELGAQP